MQVYITTKMVSGFIRILALTALFCSVNLFAQNKVIDSLEKILPAVDDVNERVSILNDLTVQYLYTDLTKARVTSRESARLAAGAKNKQMMIWSYLYEGITLMMDGDLGAAERRYLQVIDLSNKLKQTELKAYALNLIGNVKRDRGRFDSTLYYTKAALGVMAGTKNIHFLANVNLDLARYFITLDEPDSALFYAEKSRDLLLQIKDSTLLAEAYNLLANSHRQLFQYREANENLSRAIKLSDINSGSYNRSLMIKGELLFVQGDFTGALNVWKDVLDRIEHLGYRYDAAYLFYRLAEAYEEQGYLDVAMKYLNSSLRISKKSGYNYLKGLVYYEMAWVAYRSKNYPLAKSTIGDAAKEFVKSQQWLKQAGCFNVRGVIAMDESKYDSSFYFHNQALGIRERFKNKIAVSSSLYNLGDLFSKKGEYQKAIQYLWRGMRLDESINDRYGRSLYYYQIGKIYNSLKNNDSAFWYLNKALLDAEPTSANDVLQKTYLELASLLNRTGKSAQAVDFLQRYIKISDSLFSKQAAQSHAAYEALFDVDERDSQIEMLNKEVKMAEEMARREYLLIYAISAASAILLALVLFYYRVGNRLRLLNKSNVEKAEELKFQSIQLTKSNRILSDLNLALEQKQKELEDVILNLENTQNELARSQKMASLGVLAAGVAHELNNPLNFIKGGVATLEMHLNKFNSGALDQETKKYFDIIQEGVARAGGILSGLGQYSRQSDQINENCDMHRVIDNCIVILGNRLKAHVTVEKNYSEHPFIISGNDGKLHQAIINILSNAEQAISGNGIIRIATRVTPYFGEIIIEDNGCGISSENLNKIGDLFFTTKEPGKGTGLGLSITFKIIEEHDGRVSVSSELGKGTKFKLTFNFK
jgi:signal transduction histidine kinase